MADEPRYQATNDGPAPAGEIDARETTRDSDEHSPIERVLSLVDEGRQGRVDERGGSRLSVGFLRSVTEAQAQVELLEGGARIDATIAKHVDPVLVERSIREGALALLTQSAHQIQVIGFVQTNIAETTHISGKDIVIEADQKLTLRSGRAAIQLRADGALEILGTRIAATSRGVFRLVGRALRLN